MSDYTLTPVQKKSWASRVGQHLKWGRQTKLAETLAGRQTEQQASWKTRVNSFVHGHEPGLKAIFTNPRHLEIVAHELGRTPDELRRWLDEAQSDEDDSVPDDHLRVPGFEDLAPVHLDALYIEPRRNVSSAPPLGSPSTRALDHGGDWAERFASWFDAYGRPEPLIILIKGPPRSGRTTLLKQITRRLAEHGAEVLRWSPGAEVKGRIVACDDLHLRPRAHREQLLTTAARDGRLLITTVDSNAWREPIGMPGFTWTLTRRNRLELLDYVDKLREVAKESWDITLELDSLRRWIRDDPFAAEAVGLPEILTWLARDRFERRSESSRPTLAGLRDVFVAACRRRAERDDDAGAAASIGENGASILEAVAKRLLDAPWLSESEARAVLREGGVETSLEALCRSGLLRQGMDREITITPPIIAAVAIGHVAAANPHRIVEWAPRLAADRSWGEALVVAAEQLEDAAPILGALLDLPLEVACQLMPELTRVLATDVPCSDESLVELAMSRAVAWWCAYEPAKPPALAPGRLDPNRDFSEECTGSFSPLVSLGLAALRRQRELPRSINPTDWVGDSVLTPQWRAAASALGRTRRTAEGARLHAGLALPVQTGWLTNAVTWGEVVASADAAPPHTFDRIAVDLWMQVAGGPALWALGAEGDRILIGAEAGFDARPWFRGPRFAPVWELAMERRLRAGDADAIERYADSLVWTLAGPPLGLRHAARRLWECLSGLDKYEVRTKVAAALADVTPTQVKPLPMNVEYLEWFVSTVLGTTASEVWMAWCGLAREELPWAIFAPSLAPDRDRKLLAWLDARIDEDEAEFRTLKARHLAPLSIPSYSPDRLDTSREGLLDFLLLMGGVDALAWLARWVPDEWGYWAWRRLMDLSMDEEHADAARFVRLELGAERPARLYTVGGSPLAGLGPLRGEQERWLAVAEAEREAGTRLPHLICAAIAGEGAPDLWDHVVRCIEQIEAGADPFDYPLYQSAIALGSVITIGIARETPRLREILGRALAAPQFATAAREALVLFKPLVEALGVEVMLAELAPTRGTDTPDARQKLITDAAMVTPAKELAVLFAEDPERQLMLATAMTQRTRPNRADVLLDVLALWDAGPLLHPDDARARPLLELVRGVAQRDAPRAIAWLKTHLGTAPAEIASAWYARLARELPAGPARAHALKTALRPHESHPPGR